MTPQERQLVDDLFDRLEKLENNPRDPDAEDAIADGWDKAPNAAYALVQSVIVQEEALKRANDRIQELEAQLHGGSAPPPSGGSFLAGAREAMQSGVGGTRGSVPSVRAAEPAPAAPTESKWNTGQAQSQWHAQTEPQGYSNQGYGNQGYSNQQGYPGGYPQQSGGGFLGTAASAAAGVVGGALLMGGIRSLFGGHSAHASAFDPGLSGAGASPWGGGSAANSDLAREAGLNDIGNPGGGFGGAGNQAGFFGSSTDSDDSGGYDVSDVADDGGDFGGGDSSDA